MNATHSLSRWLLCAALVGAGWNGSVSAAATGTPPARAGRDTPRMLLDQTSPSSSFADPRRLVEWGYSGMVGGSVAGVQAFEKYDPGLLPKGSPQREWIDQHTEATRDRIRAAHAQGLECFPATDLFVLPKALIEKYRKDICDDSGRIDIRRPKMQEVFRALLNDTFDRLPELDGILIRTGEIYLYNYPNHAASGNFAEGKRQGGSAILHGPASHVEILKILREEVCVKRGKKVIYRTWSFGAGSFHESPKYYLAVTDAVEPHPNLILSVKHQKGDFHQLTVFNPTLMIGRHRQIIEVQSQREAYGKGAHPYYIGQGVIEGWEEYDWMMKPGEPKGLRDVVTNALYAGVWTWSRGGGWEGPSIKNELWCELNTYVVSQWARNPGRTEAEVFNDFARERLHLSEADTARFHELNLLSAQAVLRGQLTTLGARINVWWARDHFFEAPDLSDFESRGLVEKALAEKAGAVALWRRIEKLAGEIRFADAATRDFVVTSAAYGRIKYAIVEQAWTILFAGRAGDRSGQYDRERLRAAIDRYDALWQEWRELAKSQPTCSSLYKEVGFEGRPGIGATVDRYRNLLK